MKGGEGMGLLFYFYFYIFEGLTVVYQAEKNPEIQELLHEHLSLNCHKNGNFCEKGGATVTQM